MIKIYFDENTKDKTIKSETFWAFDSNTALKEEYKLFFENKNNILKKTSLEECEYIFLPYKWDGEIQKINHYANKKQKIISFFNDDYEGVVDIPKENFILFRTSTNKIDIKQNEKIMPAFCEFIPFKEPNNVHVEKKIISFCGAVWANRKRTIEEVQNNRLLNTSFIFRQGFQAPEISDKKIARKEFIENIQNSLFVLCMRGAGNFSYRLYETLSCGRIPIIINSNLKLPLETFINWKDFSIIIEEEEVRFLDFIIDEFLENKNILELCKDNQRMWDEYFSPHGFIKNIKLYIEGENK